MPFLLAATDLVSLWPFIVLLASVIFIVIGISVIRWHPFIALILAALLAGVMASFIPESTVGPDGSIVIPSLGDVIGLVTAGFGKTAGGVAISIGLAAIIGMALMESGAADKVVRRFLAAFGEKRAGFALLISTYVLSVPLFFDTMFMLMAPLAKALRLRTGKDYLLYVLCICCGGVITHSLTVPHPGPIAMVEELKIDVGISIFGGLAGGFLPLLFGYFVAKWMNGMWQIPLRDTPGASLSDLEGIVEKPESELPSFFASMMPVVVPIVLISFSSFLKIFIPPGMNLTGADAPALVGMLGGPEGFVQVRTVIDFVGDKNIALFIGTFLAIAVLMRQRGWNRATLEKHVAPALETAGLIILITSAGGAFGSMIKNAGVGAAVENLADSMGISILIVAYVLTLIIRVAQGSATVSMITASAIVYPMMQAGLPFHPVYLFLTIGFAAFSLSWMNDSGFWVVCRLSGLTEGEMLKSFSLMLTLVSAAGLIVVLIGSKLLPFA
jgi:GntP family gluconate:H+ symporter